MVLQFLPAITAGLQLMGSIQGAGQQFEAPRATQAEQQQLQTLSNINRLLQAVTDPEDVIMRNLRAGQEKLIRQEAARSLQDVIRANRRARLMGRQQFFDPERRDEAISRYTTQVAQAAGPQAEQAAVGRIMDLVGGYKGLGSQYAGLIPRQQQRQTTAEQRDIGKYGALGEVLQDVGGFWGGPAGAPMGGGMQGPTRGSGLSGSFSNIYSMLR
jgi:hypothetical protein